MTCSLANRNVRAPVLLPGKFPRESALPDVVRRELVERTRSF